MTYLLKEHFKFMQKFNLFYTYPNYTPDPLHLLKIK